MTDLVGVKTIGYLNVSHNFLKFSACEKCCKTVKLEIISVSRGTFCLLILLTPIAGTDFSAPVSESSERNLSAVSGEIFGKILGRVV